MPAWAILVITVLGAVFSALAGYQWHGTPPATPPAAVSTPSPTPAPH